MELWVSCSNPCSLITNFNLHVVVVDFRTVHYTNTIQIKFMYANHEIPLLLWNPKVHYRVHKVQPLVPVLSQMHPPVFRVVLFLQVYQSKFCTHFSSLPCVLQVPSFLCVRINRDALRLNSIVSPNVAVEWLAVLRIPCFA
jgi:hypothetical protein